MGWLWTFGSVPELEAEGILAVSKRICALSESERTSPSSPRIIDVRTLAEYEGGHIAGSRHASFLPPWAWAGNVAPILSGLQPDTELYVICLSAHRSIGALKWLRERGYGNVKQLKGGMQAWRSQSLPEVRIGGGGGGGGGGGPEGAEGGAAGGGGSGGACSAPGSESAATAAEPAGPEPRGAGTAQPPQERR